MYNSQSLLHGLASSQLPGRWLAALSSLCHASPPSGPSSQLLCWATLTLAGSPVTSPPATLSSSSLFLFNLGGHFTLYPVPKILPASSLPAPPLLPPPVATQLPGLPSTAGSQACLFLAGPHPCRHLESSSHPLLGIARPSGLLLPHLPSRLSKTQVVLCYSKRHRGRQWNIIWPQKGMKPRYAFPLGNLENIVLSQRSRSQK